ncbi:MAG TPA: hypothetical protein ENJ45_00740, partial [Phaeodactylibacter sp.]|nr:hypothetical protein [Phaeodactylibacter sp.]
SHHLYDIASVTKVAATTLATMRAYEEGCLSLNERLSGALKLKKANNFKWITIKDLLTHRSGLQSYVPITTYLNNRDSFANGNNGYFSYTKQGDFDIYLSDSMYFNHKHIDSIWSKVYQVKRKRRKRYLYSDLNFVLLQKAIEKSCNTTLDSYLEKYFYRPLNLRFTCFNPTNRFDPSNIAPTAYDKKWRKQLVRGYVHDETAALLNGVAGNAGVFSNARDMATLFQMLLNKGTYGGKRFFHTSTVELFTKRVRGGRALGFEVKTKKGTGSCSPYASNGTFGHKGFTGTCVWVDPKEELVYVFLTNRIHPNYKNTKLMRKKIRQRVHSVIYKALDSYIPQAQEAEQEIPIIMANWADEEKCQEG